MHSSSAVQTGKSQSIELHRTPCHRKLLKEKHSVSKAPPLIKEKGWHMTRASRLDHSPFELSMRSVKLRPSLKLSDMDRARRRARRLKRWSLLWADHDNVGH